MKIISIKENSDFKRLYYRGKSVVKKRIVLYYRKNRFNYNRLGITVSSKVGNAVVRNRIRRLIRENYRLFELNQGYDIVIVARTAAAFSNFSEIGLDLKKALMETEIKKDEKCFNKDYNAL
ncbi:MAG: ribonuclease P protein component [Clostridia bacterium]|nr:ribonuclease P protein component [Clostridia bacterium]